MGRGGVRVGAGRPPGSKTVNRKAKAAKAKVVDAGGGAGENGRAYLTRVMNDTTADVVRRDRAAMALAALDARGTRPDGKKLVADKAADAAATGRLAPGQPPATPDYGQKQPERPVIIPDRLRPSPPPIGHVEDDDDVPPAARGRLVN